MVNIKGHRPLVDSTALVKIIRPSSPQGSQQCRWGVACAASQTEYLHWEYLLENICLCGSFECGLCGFWDRIFASSQAWSLEIWFSWARRGGGRRRTGKGGWGSSWAYSKKEKPKIATVSPLFHKKIIPQGSHGSPKSCKESQCSLNIIILVDIYFCPLDKRLFSYSPIVSLSSFIYEIFINIYKYEYVW